MRQAARRLTRAQVARTVSVPAPVGGWNARDSLAQMDRRDAVLLENMFPTANDVRVRSGYSVFSSGGGMTGTVKSLMSYNPPSGAARLFAASGSVIYDVSSATASSSLTGLTNDEWQHCMMGTAGGNFLVICNGADAVRHWNGSAWAAPAITGATPSTLVQCNVFKQRLWFVERNSLRTWYLPVNAVAGAAASIDFSGLFNRGGSLVAMTTWSLDVGFGIDDYAVWVTSEGEVAVYQGTDPTLVPPAAGSFSLVGVYQLAKPIGRRCFVKFGGDVMYLGMDGLTPLTKALTTQGETTALRVTSKIQTAVNDYTAQFGSTFGWQTILHPAENMLLINVPTSTSPLQSLQLAMNTVTGSWAQFRGWNAACWERHNDLIYFGGSGFVGQAWSTTSDAGSNIEFSGLQAFATHGAGTQLKQVKMSRPIIATNGAPAVLLGVNADYDQTAPTGLLSYSGTTAGIWGTSTWSSGVWGGNLDIKRDWQTAFAMGYSFAAYLKGTTRNESMRWISTDYLLEDAGVL